MEVNGKQAIQQILDECRNIAVVGLCWLKEHMRLKRWGG